MHWIFQGQQQWAGYGNNLEWDFVEAPSQMLEEWMHDPKVLATFARNYQTNEPIPTELVARSQPRRRIWPRACGRASNWCTPACRLTCTVCLHRRPSWSRCFLRT